SFEFIDTDALIESEAGLRVSEIFSCQGEPAFRDLESKVGMQLASRSGLVISTGGGFVLRPENFALLKSHALVVCLWATAETLYERVRNQDHRPLLRDPDPLGRIRKLLMEREPVYRQADVLVNTEQRSVRELAQHIAHEFRSCAR
ncbi:MAG: shikimate kinase, partial [Verrucomicrobia bacterium]|nr:shikimate kinase [Verrucomicrobiota bacterium]